MRSLAIHATLLFTTCLPVSGSEPEREYLFETDVAPILKTYCWKCHGGGGLAGDIRLKAWFLHHRRDTALLARCIPTVELEAIKGREEWIGSCSDVGHWPRSGLNSLECLKKLDGHIFELHFKDVAKVDDKPTYEDRPWGTGGNDVKGMLTELKRQKFKGVFLVEYEITSGKELEENVAKSVAFFDKTANELAKA